MYACKNLPIVSYKPGNGTKDGMPNARPLPSEVVEFNSGIDVNFFEIPAKLVSSTPVEHFLHRICLVASLPL